MEILEIEPSTIESERELNRSSAESTDTHPVGTDSAMRWNRTSLPEFTWNEDFPVAETYRAFGTLLAESRDLYRNGSNGHGLIVAPGTGGPPRVVVKGADLAPAIVDRVNVRVVRGGELKGNRIPTAHLNTMLAAEAFLQQFPAVDVIAKDPLYLSHFRLVQPGHNDGGHGHGVLYTGGPPSIKRTFETIARFLDMMEFASPADRANTVAAALTRLLRHFWPGGKPFIPVSATKSHAGKETIISFVTGGSRHTSISYQQADWALERAFVGALKKDPDVGVISVDNARLGPRAAFIRSSFLERMITDPEPLLFSTGTGPPVRRQNDFIVAASTNEGLLGDDLLNRALPIRLAPTGDIAQRESPIGNPKLQFLPAKRDEIEAELIGMVERWKDAGMPLNRDVQHPFTEWAHTVGGILEVNGFEGFLENYSLRRTEDSPVRRGLGLLGAARPDAWWTASDWASLIVELGLVKILIPEADRENRVSRTRGIGVVLSAHSDEVLQAQTDDEHITCRLESARRRFAKGANPQKRYRFRMLARKPLPEDPSGDEQASVP